MLLSTIPTSFLTRNHKKNINFSCSYHQNQVQNALLYFGEVFEEKLLQISQFTADTIRFKVWIIKEESFREMKLKIYTSLVWSVCPSGPRRDRTNRPPIVGPWNGRRQRGGLLVITSCFYQGYLVVGRRAQTLSPLHTNRLSLDFSHFLPFALSLCLFLSKVTRLRHPVAIGPVNTDQAWSCSSSGPLKAAPERSGVRGCSWALQGTYVPSSLA